MFRFLHVVTLLIVVYSVPAVAGDDEYAALLQVYRQLNELHQSLQDQALIQGAQGDPGDAGEVGPEGYIGVVGERGAGADSAIAEQVLRINTLLIQGEVWVDDLTVRMSTLIDRTEGAETLVTTLDSEAARLEAGNN